MRKLKNIPTELKEVAHWVTFGRSGRGIPLKKPFNPCTGEDARVNDPETWAGFEACRKAVAKGDYCGVGYVFTGDYIVIDLDSVIDAKGNVLPLAAEIIEKVDSYTERSISGRGFHIIARKPDLQLTANRSQLNRLGIDPGTLRRFTYPKLDRLTGELKEKKPEIELYTGGRYVAVTGDVWQGRAEIKDAPQALEWLFKSFIERERENTQAATKEAVTGDYSAPQAASDMEQTVIERMKRGSNRGEIARLMRGDTSGYDSQSEADMRLCGLLAFYTDKDAALMDALFRRSRLCDRKKWDEDRGGMTYGQRTIAHAIANHRGTYSQFAGC